MMRRFVCCVAALTLLGTAPAFAGGTTPPGRWLPVIKDALRTKLKNPEYVTFKRIFYDADKTENGKLSVCGYVSAKQRKEDHPPRLPFYGLLTPPDNGQTGAFEVIKLGENDDLAKDVLATCKDKGLD